MSKIITHSLRIKGFNQWCDILTAGNIAYISSPSLKQAEHWGLRVNNLWDARRCLFTSDSFQRQWWSKLRQTETDRQRRTLSQRLLQSSLHIRCTSVRQTANKWLIRCKRQQGRGSIKFYDVSEQNKNRHSDIFGSRQHAFSTLTLHAVPHIWACIHPLASGMYSWQPIEGEGCCDQQSMITSSSTITRVFI